MSRLIMHVDLDAFYAAVEQRDHPEWRGRPLVVGAAPGQRGVVATCSYEARRFGVHSAMPMAQAVRRLPPQTVYVRPRMSHYAEVSRQIMAVLADISPLVERVSIDEAYLDVSGLTTLIGAPTLIGQTVKDRIRSAVGLTASVGIGPNRLIAKLASEARKPDGLTLVAPEQVGDFLAPMPCAVLRGVGIKTAPRLAQLGVTTVGEVRRLSLEALRQHLGARTGNQLYQQAQGIADDQVYPDRPRQSISRETTFPEDVTDPQILEEALRRAEDQRNRAADVAPGACGHVEDPLPPVRDAHLFTHAQSANGRCGRTLSRRLVTVRGQALVGPTGAAHRAGYLGLAGDRGGRAAGSVRNRAAGAPSGAGAFDGDPRGHSTPIRPGRNSAGVEPPLAR